MWTCHINSASANLCFPTTSVMFDRAVCGWASNSKPDGNERLPLSDTPVTERWGWWHGNIYTLRTKTIKIEFDIFYSIIPGKSSGENYRLHLMLPIAAGRNVMRSPKSIGHFLLAAWMCTAISMSIWPFIFQIYKQMHWWRQSHNLFSVADGKKKLLMTVVLKDATLGHHLLLSSSSWHGALGFFCFHFYVKPFSFNFSYCESFCWHGTYSITNVLTLLFS